MKEKCVSAPLYHSTPIPLRPYRLLCLLCLLGEERAAAEREGESARPPSAVPRPHREDFLRDLLTQLRATPDHPLALVCNAGDVFAYQEPGTEDDSPEGAEYNTKRDLDILRAMDLVPGCVMPARALLHRLQHTITTVKGVCGYEACTAAAWRGCARANTGFYERGVRLPMDEILPVRSDAERAREKEESLAAMRRADTITIRPHLLLCAVCQYGSGIRPPLDADNLPELVALILEKPQTRITLVRGADWMICAPCKRRVAALNACVNVWGTGGLSNELRDLNVLQHLGLTYGTTMPAAELFRLLFERLPTTAPVCAKDNAKPSAWWDPCGDRKSGNPHYVIGRQMLQAAGLG